MKLRLVVGFLTLLIFTLWLVIVTVINTFQTQGVFTVVFMFFVLGSLRAFYRVLRDEVIGLKKIEYKFASYRVDFLMVFVGAIITYIVHVYLGAGPILASGFVGLMAGFFVKKHAVAIFCGSFVGMSSPLLLGLVPFILASLFASLIFVLAKEIYNGYGGKLGTIAMSGALISAILLGEALDGPIPFTMSEQLTIIAVSLVAAVITYVLSIRLKQGPVIASALVGVVAGAMLPLINDFGLTLAVAAYGASFVGMSNQKRLPDERYLVLAGILFGLIYVFSAPYFTGAGGKLGTIAFASTLSVGGIKMIFDNIKVNQKSC